MNSDAILGMLTLGTYFTMLVIEAIWPAREFPTIRRWRLVGFGFFAVIMALGVVTPFSCRWSGFYAIVSSTARASA